ncbi:MAG TPA: chromate transporter [Bacteroidota bacterium]|jgi:chromate transporter|nr:chromate transporter [Bacteroidota bacterium]
MIPQLHPDTLPASPLRELVLYFLKLGTTGFGGPIALVGYMERDLVHDRRWISREEYLRGLALAQLAPGPLAAQLAIYIGYLRGRITGATLAGIAFILPSFLMVLALGMLYVQYGGLAWIQSLFYGISAAVIGIIIRSAYKLTGLTLKNKKLLWVIFVLVCAVTAYAEEEYFLLFIASGVVALIVYAPPFNFTQRALLVCSPITFSVIQTLSLQESDSLARIFLFFSKAGAFVFGSGLAIVPFLYGGVVQQYHWLNERQFLDAVAVAMITPGPVVITVGFIGYLVARVPGAVAAAAGVFLPVYLFVILPAPYVERFARNLHLTAFIEGVTAAATGAIAGAVIVLGRRAITDIPTVLIAGLTLLVLFRWKVPEPIIIGAAGLIGFLVNAAHL